jgi:hypothetical protein
MEGLCGDRASGPNGRHQGADTQNGNDAFEVEARTWRLISVLTRFNVRVRKCVEPIQALMVPNECPTVCRRMRMISGA